MFLYVLRLPRVNKEELTQLVRYNVTTTITKRTQKEHVKHKRRREKDSVQNVYTREYERTHW